jgi:hypothetical protein
MRVSFLTFGQLHGTASGRTTSDTASARYRALLPAEHLGGHGIAARVFSTDEQFWQHAGYSQVPADVVVFSKSFDRRNERLAEALKRAGCRVCFDICDNHFEHPRYGAHYRYMTGIADLVTASTPAMAQIVRLACGRDAHVVGDPVETRRGAARFAPSATGVRILWFGHPVNADTLQAVLPELAAASAAVPLQLTACTTPSPLLHDELASWSRRSSGTLQCRVVPWSVAALEGELAQCDLVIIPSLATDRKNVKSPNRLTEALWAGRMVVAFPLPSYLQYSDYALISPRIGDAVLAVLREPSGQEARIRAGQEYIAEHSTPEVIAARWSAVFRGRAADGAAA